MTATRPGTGFDRRLLPPMIVGATLNPINSSIIAVSLVPIGAAFGAPPSQTAWLVSALYLATSIGQPVFGRLVDVLGPRRMFLIGAGLTGVAGVLGTLAPNLPVLVVARVILGLGTCAGYPVAMYLVRREAERTGHDSPGSVLTALAIAGQTTAVLGPALGGLLIAVGGWRTTLALNVPLAIACFWLGARRLPRRSAPASAAHDFDVPGIALFAATIVTLLLFVMTPRRNDAWLLLVAVVAAAVFVRRELRHRDPFVDLRVLGGNGPLVRTYVRTFLAQFVAYSFLYGFTQWLQDGRHLPAGQAGLLLLPMFAVGIGVSALTGRSPRLRPKLLVAAGAQLVAVLVLFVLGAHTPVWALLGLVLLLGVPQGLNNLANQNAVYSQADGERIAASAGLLRTFVYLGAIAASAAGGVVFGTRIDSGGLHELAAVMLVVSLAFGVITVLDRSLGRTVRTKEELEHAVEHPRHHPGSDRRRPAARDRGERIGP